MQEERLTPPERELERALGRLRPAAPSVDRDRLMFRAGRSSMRGRCRLWQAASALLAAAVCVSVAVQWQAPRPREVVYVMRERPARPAPVAVARAVSVPAPQAPVPVGEATYLKVRDDVLAKGLDALKEPEPPAPDLQANGWLELIRPLASRREQTPPAMSFWTLFGMGDGA